MQSVLLSQQMGDRLWPVRNWLTTPGKRRIPFFRMSFQQVCWFSFCLYSENIKTFWNPFQQKKTSMTSLQCFIQFKTFSFFGFFHLMQLNWLPLYTWDCLLLNLKEIESNLFTPCPILYYYLRLNCLHDKKSIW